MQAIELETSIHQGEIHIRLPSSISAEHAKVIVLYETTALTEPSSNDELVRFLDTLAENPAWPVRTKAEIDQALDEERSSWD